MKITAILNTHGVIPVTIDTLDSIRRYMTDQVIVVVDGLAWHQYADLDIPAFKLKGIEHGHYKAPYRNVLLGLQQAATKFPTSDWYCYLEYDCLLGSYGFRKDLSDDYWCIGTNFRQKQDANLTFMERIIKDKFKEIFYLLGACVFYHRNFMEKLLEIDFFEKLLFYTNEFKQGHFLDYKDHDLTEHLMPTMVRYLGGKIKELSAHAEFDFWTGNYRKYPIRYKPDLAYREDYFLQASIMHPLKKLDDPIREYHRSKRQQS